jgi:hypothetical protein
MRRFEGTDVVRPVSGHEGDVTQVFEGVEDKFLLARRDAGVDPGVADEVEPSGKGLELSESGAGDADIE